jgi:hypothetical protein
VLIYAQKNGRCVKKNMYNSCSVMYIRVCVQCILYCCCDVYLYISEEPPRGQKIEALSLTAINSTHRVGHGNKIHARKKGPEPGSVYNQNEAMKDILARRHKKTNVQVCTLTIMHCCPVTVNIRTIATYATFLQLATSISMHV